jgi:carbamate kinase
MSTSVSSLTRSPAPGGRLLVVALGGNAIQQPGQMGTFEEQLFNVDGAARRIASLVAAGDRVVVTHGNGPQVGNLLIQNELASGMVAPMPMDVCGAQSQGQVGYVFQQCLANHMRRLDLPAQVATIVTQTEDSPADPAFARPTKPVGPFYDESRARELQLERGVVMREDAGRGWRRVVPSPEPLRQLQAGAIRDLAEAGVLVVCSGGGGVPVVRQKSGDYRGVEAVIDKDLAAGVLAAELAADTLVILTDVTNVYLHYNTPEQVALGHVSLDEMAASLAAGQFASGSMGPKVDAALRFVRTGGTSIIANLFDLEAALAGERGTRIGPAADATRSAIRPRSAALLSRRPAEGRCGPVSDV